MSKKSLDQIVREIQKIQEQKRSQALREESMKIEEARKRNEWIRERMRMFENNVLTTSSSSSAGAGAGCLLHGFIVDFVSAGFIERFENEGRPVYVRYGSEGVATPMNPVWCAIWTDGAGLGFGWHISDGDAGVLYFSSDDVTSPDLATSWTAVGVGLPEDPGIGPLQCMDSYTE